MGRRKRLPYFRVSDTILSEPWTPEQRGILVGLMALMSHRWAAGAGPQDAARVVVSDGELARITGRRQRPAAVRSLLEVTALVTAEVTFTPAGLPVVDWPGFRAFQEYEKRDQRERPRGIPTQKSARSESEVRHKCGTREPESEANYLEKQENATASKRRGEKRREEDPLHKENLSPQGHRRPAAPADPPLPLLPLLEAPRPPVARAVTTDVLDQVAKAFAVYGKPVRSWGEPRKRALQARLREKFIDLDGQERRVGVGELVSAVHGYMAFHRRPGPSFDPLRHLTPETVFRPSNFPKYLEAAAQAAEAGLEPPFEIQRDPRDLSPAEQDRLAADRIYGPAGDGF